MSFEGWLVGKHLWTSFTVLSLCIKDLEEEKDMTLRIVLELLRQLVGQVSVKSKFPFIAIIIIGSYSLLMKSPWH